MIREMKHKKVLVSIAPAIMRLALKAIQYSKDGFTKEEARDLGADLLTLAITIINLAQEEQ